MMTAVSLYDRILGHPFVYHHIRPLVVGIDYTFQYAALDASSSDRILDIGCGGGDALRYLKAFESYHGYDTDPVAIGFARQRLEAQRDNVHFTAALVGKEALEEVRPTRVMMNGLLHHLDDEAAIELLALCREAPDLGRIVTNDTVYVPGAHLNNLLASLDRGKFVRNADGYRALAERAGLRVRQLELVRSHPRRGVVQYTVMVLSADRAQRR